MKQKQIQRFATTHLLPQLGGFRADGKLLYQIPVGNILHAILFDSSGFSAETFHPQVFVQPLYVPSEHIVLSLGERFLGNWKFEADAEETLAQKLLNRIHSVALPFLQRHAHPEDIVREIKPQISVREVSYYTQRTLTYSLLLLGRNDEGLDELDRLLGTIGPDNRPWAGILKEQIATLRETLMRNPVETRAMLDRWTEETRTNLRLPA